MGLIMVGAYVNVCVCVCVCVSVYVCETWNTRHTTDA